MTSVKPGQESSYYTGLIGIGRCCVLQCWCIRVISKLLGEGISCSGLYVSRSFSPGLVLSIVIVIGSRGSIDALLPFLDTISISQLLSTTIELTTEESLKIWLSRNNL